jgi:hypothetical protein
MILGGEFVKKGSLGTPHKPSDVRICYLSDKI